VAEPDEPTAPAPLSQEYFSWTSIIAPKSWTLPVFGVVSRKSIAAAVRRIRRDRDITARG
jgi:hypothetical protein